MEKLKELISSCKSEIEISINHHKGSYSTVDKWISEEDQQDIDPDVFLEMIRRDTIIRIQFYPDSPVGFYVVYHYDIDKALELALQDINEK